MTKTFEYQKKEREDIPNFTINQMIKGTKPNFSPNLSPDSKNLFANTALFSLRAKKSGKSLHVTLITPACQLKSISNQSWTNTEGQLHIIVIQKYQQHSGININNEKKITNNEIRLNLLFNLRKKTY